MALVDSVHVHVTLLLMLVQLCQESNFFFYGNNVTLIFSLLFEEIFI